MIQDIGQHVFDNSYRPLSPRGGDYVLHYAADASCRGADSVLVTGNGMLAAERDGRLALPTMDDYRRKPAVVYLFSIDDVRFFLATDVVVDVPEGFSYLGLNGCRYYEPRWLAFAAITGFQLWDWRRHTRYCGMCGKPLAHAPRSREMVCPSCGNVVYPRINIGVIVAICDGERLLLTRYAGTRYTRHALVAGYTEVGETLEQCCEREIREEVGLSVRDLRYFANQPWSFSDTLLVGFWARLDGSDELTVQHSELKEAVWVDRADLPRTHEDTSSLTNHMIETFARGEDPYSEA